MAEASYVKSIFGSVPDAVKLAADRAFTYVLSNLKFGAVAHQTRATNFQAYWLTGTTSSNASEEFSIAHGLGYAPNVVFPVLSLTAINERTVNLSVTRAADAQRIYLSSPSTSAAIALLVE